MRPNTVDYYKNAFDANQSLGSIVSTNPTNDNPSKEMDFSKLQSRELNPDGLGIQDLISIQNQQLLSHRKNSSNVSKYSRNKKRWQNLSLMKIDL